MTRHQTSRQGREMRLLCMHGLSRLPLMGVEACSASPQHGQVAGTECTSMAQTCPSTHLLRCSTANSNRHSSLPFPTSHPLSGLLASLHGTCEDLVRPLVLVLAKRATSCSSTESTSKALMQHPTWRFISLASSLPRAHPCNCLHASPQALVSSQLLSSHDISSHLHCSHSPPSLRSNIRCCSHCTHTSYPHNQASLSVHFLLLQIFHTGSFGRCCCSYCSGSIARRLFRWRSCRLIIRMGSSYTFQTHVGRKSACPENAPQARRLVIHRNLLHADIEMRKASTAWGERSSQGSEHDLAGPLASDERHRFAR